MRPSTSNNHPPNHRPDQWATLQALMEQACNDGISAIAGAIGRGSTVLWSGCSGRVECSTSSEALGPHHQFDVASLTKVCATLPLILLAVEGGDLHLTQTVASMLPEFNAGPQADVTLAQLLTHSSGLPAHVQFWHDVASDSNVRTRVLSTPLEAEAGTRVQYSDVGFMILGFILEQVYGERLSELFIRKIAAPLNLSATGYLPPDPSQCVATEEVVSRGGVIRGIVHDENAAWLGGVAGHAGLFATLDDLVQIAMMWGSTTSDIARPLLSTATRAMAVRDHTSHIDPRAARGLGWVLTPNPFAVPIDLASQSTWSHTGFTGTSMVIDPFRNLWAVLLTNRVHPTRHGDSAERIRKLRARFHNVAWATAD